MPGATSRRQLLRYLGVASTVPVAGCSEGRSSPSRSPRTFEPRDTDPVRVRGEPVTVERRASSLDVRVLDDGSVDPDGDGASDAFGRWAASRSVDLADAAIRDALTARVDRLDGGTETRWELQWEPDRSRFLVTTTSRIGTSSDPSAEENVAFPSILYDQLESLAPETVTVVVSTERRTASNEFPVYARARLRRE